MPARTNPFQQFIVKVLQLQYPPDAKVEESKMVYSKDMDDDTEVDVVVTTTSGPTTVRLGFECRDHSRTATVEWVRGVAHKKTEVHIDKWFLVNSKGFSARARTMAKNNNIVLMVLEDLTTETDRELGRVKKVLKAAGIIEDTKPAIITEEGVGRGEKPVTLTTVHEEGKEKQFRIEHRLPPGTAISPKLTIEWQVPGTNIRGVTEAPLVFHAAHSVQVVGRVTVDLVNDAHKDHSDEKYPDFFYVGDDKKPVPFFDLIHGEVHRNPVPPIVQHLLPNHSITLDFSAKPARLVWLKIHGADYQVNTITGKVQFTRIEERFPNPNPVLHPECCFIKCRHCNKCYHCPIEYRSKEAFLETTLIGERVTCTICKATSKCKKDDLIYI